MAMGNEPLRRFCDASKCQVWLAIRHFECNGHTAMIAGSELPAESEMREFCKNNCMAFKYHAWLKLSNLNIVPNEGKDRYVQR